MLSDFGPRTSDAYADPPEGFVAIFNGKDLTGWKGFVANPKQRAEMSPEELAEAQMAADAEMRAHWKAVDGVLEFDGKGKNLCTAEDYGDFELYVDWKIAVGGDSGIYLRGCPQVQIWDTKYPDYKSLGAEKGSGALWNNKDHPRFPLVHADKPPGEWNTFYIKMVGERVTVKLNGQLVTDDVVMENLWERDKPIYPTGSIELQNHGNKLWFRNISLRPLAQDASRNREAQPLELIRVSDDGKSFVKSESGEPFVVWGVNYDHDSTGRLIEDYWGDEWASVVEDFQEIKALGANTVRIHLQVAKIMDSAEQPNAANLSRLKQLVQLAENTGLYLDVTGLGCYHKQDVPAWYDELEEAERWEVQARFWRAVAGVCKDSSAIFFYDLMNEPILPGNEPASEWLAGEFGGKHFVQRITLDLKGRTRIEVAREWVAKLTSAIREIDDRHLITVGVIPWAHTFKGAKPIFHSPEAGEPLDFVAVHFYPEAGKVDEALEALAVYEVDKPLVVEEIFPLRSSIEEVDQFIEQSRGYVDGWISFYWGTTVEQAQQQGGGRGTRLAQWLTYFRDHAPPARSSE